MATQTVDAADHKLLVAGEWKETGEWREVASPYDGSAVGRVAVGDAATVVRAAAAAYEAFASAGFPQHERAAVLDRAAELVEQRVEELALTIAAEAGKPLKTATAEAQRCVQTLTFSAVEARKLTGGTVPMDASAAGAGKLGVMLRVPYGVLKPAGQTPISALKLAEILSEAGLPEGWLSVIPGPGSTVGNQIVESELVRAISFTGSAAVGWDIRSRAPHKKVNLELGSNAPLIVHSDGDWAAAADKAQIHAFSHAGQSCISIQRILVHEDVADAFTERLVSNVAQLQVGDPLDPDTDVGPLITPDDRHRVKGWIDEAVAGGAGVLTGGELVDEGRCLAPTLLQAPAKDSKVWCEEIFGPVATIDTYADFEDALALANDSKFGLQAGVFTTDIGRGLEAGRKLEFGGVLINEVPTFRADQQPYGGVKDSGNTREGPAYAVLELTEERFVTLQG